MTSYFDCPHCNAENSTEVTIVTSYTDEMTCCRCGGTMLVDVLVTIEVTASGVATEPVPS